MPALPDLIRPHIDYTHWASQRLVSAADQLSEQQRTRDFGTADKSVEGTISHLFRSESIWLMRMEEGIAHDPSKFSAPTSWPMIQTEWLQVQQRWKDWAGGLDEAALHQSLVYRDLKKVQREEPLWQIVLHVVNHSTHHRGQVSGFLRALGETPPPLDLIAFVREQQSAA